MWRKGYKYFSREVGYFKTKMQSNELKDVKLKTSLNKIDEVNLIYMIE